MTRLLLASGLVAVGLLASSLAPASAVAATGDLDADGCLKDGDFPAGGCTSWVSALSPGAAIAISPDGRGVHEVTGGNGTSGSLTTIFRSTAATYANLGCFTDDDDSDADCLTEISALGGANAVAVSPDGGSVYVASSRDDAVVAFDRDPSSNLTHLGCIDDNDTATDPQQGEDVCAQTTNGLRGASGIAVSPDSEQVYVSSREDDALVVFDRNPADGTLTPAGCWDDNDTGADTCGDLANGLGGAEDVATSPDGKSVYVASRGDDAIVHVHRNPGSGALTGSECYDNNVSNPPVPADEGEDTCLVSAEVDGLHGANSITVSPDNLSVYATSVFDHAIARLDRDQGDGLLTPAGCRRDNDSGGDCPPATAVDGLGGPASVRVSPDGESVYVASLADQAVVSFYRGTSGSLTAGGCIDDLPGGPDTCDDSAEGLVNAAGIAVTPDGKAVLAAAGPWLTYLSREDVTPPETTITAGPANGAILDVPAVDYGFASSEPLTRFFCGLDGDFDPCTSPFTLTVDGLAPGTHEFEVFGVDPSDNVEPNPASRTFVVPAPPDPGNPPTVQNPPTAQPPSTPRKRCKRKGKKSRSTAVTAKRKKCKRKRKR